MPKILCITPNPAVDRTMIIPALHVGAIHRSYNIVVDAGGKGLNVARAVRRLGGEARCAGFLGGLSGERIRALAAADGLENAWTEIADETRTCIIIAAEDGSESTVVNENGPTVTGQEWQRLLNDVVTAAEDCALVCSSGSLPAGSAPDALPQLIRAVEAAGRPIWVDTSGEPLRHTLAARPTMIKVNGDEIGAALGMTVTDAPVAAKVAREIVADGILFAVITLGADGAVLASAEETWWAQVPAQKIVSAVASGDCFLAGLAMAHAAGASVHEALRHAVAAGTANAMTTGGARFAQTDVDKLLAEVTLTAL